MGSFDSTNCFNYDSNDVNVLKCPKFRLSHSGFVPFFLAEYALRGLTQREEALQHKAKALEKASLIDDNRDQLDYVNQELQKIQAEFTAKEYAIYKNESMYPCPFKESHRSLKQEPRWYMREELVRDCSDQGGCCSRGCGCCGKRDLSIRSKGHGHCTAECWCCIATRGFELPEKEKKNRKDDFKDRLAQEESIYFEMLVNCFFLPLKLREILK